MLIRRRKSMKDRQLKWQKEKRTKEQTMKYKTQHRKLKMITNDITNQITITIYLLHYLIKLRGVILVNYLYNINVSITRLCHSLCKKWSVFV